MIFFILSEFSEIHRSMSISEPGTVTSYVSGTMIARSSYIQVDKNANEERQFGVGKL